MAKKWVPANFKSRGDAMEHCAFDGRVKTGKGMVVFCDVNGHFRESVNCRHINMKDQFWNSFETMMIEVDEPELEVGKLYEVSDWADFSKHVYTVKFDSFDSGGNFKAFGGRTYFYYREIPSDLIGKIK